MKKRLIVDGYASAIPSHTDPVQRDPPLPILKQKETESFMGHCLKQFIRERLYGNCINYTKVHNNKKLNLISLISKTQDKSIINAKPTSSMQDVPQRRISQTKTLLEKRIENRYHSHTKQTSEDIEQETGNPQNSFGKIKQSLILQASRNRNNKSAFESKQSPSQKSEKSLEYDMDKYKCSSFLSAIEEDDCKHSNIKKIQRLNPISKNSNIIQKIERIKTITKQPTTRVERDTYVINMNTWDLFSQKNKQKYQSQLDNQSLIKDQSAIFENRSIHSNTVTTTQRKSNLQLQSIIAFDKPKFSYLKSPFSKDLFNEYLSNSKYALKSLAQLFLNFFQLNGKFYDEMKIEDYKQVIQIMAIASPRVWAIFSFRFWDADQSGLICSNDIFKIYNDLDSFQTQLKSNYNNCQNFRSYKVLTSLQQTLQTLRQIILQNKFNKQVNSLSTQKTNIQSNVFEIKYLEESLLRKKQVRYSDLILILGNKIKISKKEVNKSVIETSKQMNIKFLSCYRFSLLATDHNQQTREDREHIQNLKESLKNQKMELVSRQNQNELINKKLQGIDYITFIEKKLYITMKEIAYIIFGIQLIDQK